MSFYTEEQQKMIHKAYYEVHTTCDNIIFNLHLLNNKLQNKQTNEYIYEYIHHGILRRLGIIVRCIENIFTIYPLDRKNLLSKEELSDLNINLHAFFININGILDNLAWVFVYASGLYLEEKEKSELKKHDVGLFNKNTQNHLKEKFKTYLSSETVDKWNKEYSKNYRDALAHRIPLYVPSSTLNSDEAKEYEELKQKSAQLCQELEQEVAQLRQDSSETRRLENLDGIKKICDQINEINDQQSKLGKLASCFMHSFSEKSNPVPMHIQVVTDFKTITNFIKNFLKLQYGMEWKE